MNELRCGSLPAVYHTSKYTILIIYIIVHGRPLILLEIDARTCLSLLYLEELLHDSLGIAYRRSVLGTAKEKAHVDDDVARS